MPGDCEGGSRIHVKIEAGTESEVKRMDDVFTIKARRCKRCGGILTSAQALRDGYGSCCLQKIRKEERAKEEAKNQYSLFTTMEADAEPEQ